MRTVTTAGPFERAPKKPAKIKPTDFAETRSALQDAVRTLKQLTQCPLPADILKEVGELAKRCANYDLSKYKPKGKPVSGPVLTLAQVKKIVQDASGYTFKAQNGDTLEMMQIVEDETGPIEDLLNEDNRARLERKTGAAGPSEEVANDLLENYGLTVDPKTIRMYTLTRRFRDRSELNTVVVACFPGHVWIVHMESDRWSQDHAPVPNGDLASVITSVWG